MASDMIYPLMPVFLTQYLHAGQGFVGLVEGFAESTAAFFTLLSGIWADRAKDRSKLVLTGYTLSSLSKPLIAIAWNPWVVFFVRFFDRIGKGIRTSPRDALIADSIDHHVREAAYGLHRSMDNAGAVMGPLVATFLLTWFIKDLRQLFWIAVIPGLASLVLIIWKVREISPAKRVIRDRKFSFQLPKGKLRIYLGILFLFMLSCSSDAFLLLRAGELGVPTPLLPLIWMLLSIVKAATTYPFGRLSDRVGHRKLILIGWIVYIAVYVAFALADATWHAWALFAAYGFFYGLTEGSERAVLVEYAQADQRGESFGWFYFIVGLGALPASLIFGLIWQNFGSKTAFLMSASISTLAALLLFIFLLKVPSVTGKKLAS